MLPSFIRLCIDISWFYWIPGPRRQVVLLWDSTTGSVLRRMKVHPDWVVDVCWISADTFASCSTDPTIVVSRFGSDAPVRRFSHQVNFFSALTLEQTRPTVELKMFSFSAPPRTGLGVRPALERPRVSAGLVFQRRIHQSESRRIARVIASAC